MIKDRIGLHSVLLPLLNVLYTKKLVACVPLYKLDSDDFDITVFPSGPGAPAGPGSPWAPCANKIAHTFHLTLRPTIRQDLNIDTENFYTSGLSI